MSQNRGKFFGERWRVFDGHFFILWREWFLRWCFVCRFRIVILVVSAMIPHLVLTVHLQGISSSSLYNSIHWHDSHHSHMHSCQETLALSSSLLFYYVTHDTHFTVTCTLVKRHWPSPLLSSPLLLCGSWHSFYSHMYSRQQTLARNGYYDNVIFHRVIKGFMIQVSTSKYRDIRISLVRVIRVFCVGWEDFMIQCHWDANLVQFK